MSATTEAVEANDTSTAKPSIGRRDIYTLLCFCQTTNPERGYEPPGRAQIPTNIINMIIRLIEPSSDSGKDRRPRLEPRSLLQAHCSLQLTNRPTNSDIKQRIIFRISFRKTRPVPISNLTSANVSRNDTLVHGVLGRSLRSSRCPIFPGALAERARNCFRSIALLPRYPGSEPVDQRGLDARLITAAPIGIDSFPILKLRADIDVREWAVEEIDGSISRST